MSKKAESGAIDRISDLPDELLSRILLLLPTKNAVATSVLSTRWRYLFASVTSLDFNDSLFLYPQEHKKRCDRIPEMFMDFVDHVLFSNKLPLNRFSLTCGEAVDPARVNGWIRDLPSRGIQELCLHLFLAQGYRLPSDIFSCTSVVVLKLDCHRALDVPLDFCLPNLTSLHLGSIILWEDDSFRRLLSGCIVLEELDIDGVCCGDVSGCYVSIGTLKRLCIRNLDVSTSNVTLKAQDLTYLEYSDIIAFNFSVAQMDSLVEAHIDLQIMDYNIGEIAELIRGIKNVHSLYLSADSVEFIPQRCAIMPVFSNLTYLVIKSRKHRGWQGLPGLLRNSPNLQTLVFDGILHCIGDKCGDACNCFPEENITSCLKSSPLKKIEILSFRGCEKEVKLIAHFLENSPALEMMIIHTRKEGEALLQVTQKLLMLSRASTKCRVQIAWHSKVHL